jgi:hypothetical protein
VNSKRPGSRSGHVDGDFVPHDVLQIVGSLNGDAHGDISKSRKVREMLEKNMGSLLGEEFLEASYCVDGDRQDSFHIGNQIQLNEFQPKKLGESSPKKVSSSRVMPMGELAMF